MINRRSDDGSAAAEVLRAQAQLIRRNAGTALVGTQILAGAVALETYLFGHQLAVLWLYALFTSVQVARAVFIVVAHRSDMVERRPAAFLMQASLGSLTTGVCWGCVPMLAWHFGGREAAEAAAISTVGVAAGAILLSASRATYALMYAIPAVSGALAQFVAEGSLSGWMLAGCTAMYMAVMVVCALRVEELLVRSISLAGERSRLIVSLEQANARAQVAMQNIAHLALHDALTGLLNRAAVTQELPDRLSQARRTGCSVGVMMLDLDHFKQVNDIHGHPAGDQLLIEVAARITSVVRSGDCVVRLGGDEFMVLFLGDVQDAEAISRRLIGAMAEPVTISAHGSITAVNVGVSIGVAICPQHGTSIDALMSNADIALYDAKNGGRMRWTFFHEALGDAARTQQTIEADLRQALAAQTIAYHYQPQVRLADGRVTGFEALLRWDHPTLGRIAPTEVVAAAHRSNQSEALICYLLNHACQMVARIDAPELAAAAASVLACGALVAINISPRAFQLCDVAGLTETVLATHGVDPARIEIDITEDAILNFDQVGDQFRRLAALGVRLAVDDFGTGYASIARLTNLSIDRIKIDRRFVSTLDHSDAARTLFAAIATIGHGLSIEILAEGVETIAQRDAVGTAGCTVAQGYLFAPAMPPEAVEEWLTTLAPRAPWRRLAGPRSIDSLSA